MARPAIADGATGLLFLAMLSAAACRPLPTLEIEYQGCLYTLTGEPLPTCVLDEAEPSLRLWARSAPGVPIAVAAGGRHWSSADAEPIQGGYLFRVEDLDADALVVEAGSWSARSRQTLPLAKRRKPPYLGEKRQQLEARLESGVPDRDLGFLLFVLAHAAGKEKDFAAASDHFDAAARTFAEAGQIDQQISALTVWHYHLYNWLENVEAAGDVLTRLPPPPAGDGGSACLVAFYRGSWANRVGRFRTALREFETAGRQAERLALPLRLYLELERVHLLSRLGRYDEARRLIGWLEREAESLQDNPCTLVSVFNNIGWSELLMLEAGRAVDPVPALTRGLAAAEACEQPDRIRNVETNLTLAHLYAGRLREAQEHFLRVTELEQEPPWWIRVWSLDIEARIALAEGRPGEAVALYEQLAGGSEAAFYADAQWRAAVGLGQALEAMGRPEEALAAYARAEEKVWQASLAVPLDEGRHSSVNLYQRGTARHLDLLLRLGRKQEALELARKSRARTFRGLVIDSRLEELDRDEKGEWRRLIARYRGLQAGIRATMAEEETASAEGAEALRGRRVDLENEVAAIFDGALVLLDAEELAARAAPKPPDPGELLLIYHPLDRGWVGFAADSETTEVARLDDFDAGILGDDEALSARLLAPFADSIQRAETIRILPYGRLWGIHFHALPFDESPLVAQAPVVYGLDLPPALRPATASRDALLIADPTRSLARASGEIESVRHRLENAETPWQVRVLAPPEVTVAAAREELDAGAALFHFAGHGDLIGWGSQSGLVFAEGFEGKVLLSLREVLTLGRAPATVVLSGCETVRPASLEAPASLGVGHAFLLAGSQHAVGALETVDDQQAEELIRIFYRGWNGPGSEAAALRQAQLELARRDAPGWSSFRVLER